MRDVEFEKFALGGLGILLFTAFSITVYASWESHGWCTGTILATVFLTILGVSFGYLWSIIDWSEE